MTNQVPNVAPWSRTHRETRHLKIGIVLAATLLLAGCEKRASQGGGNPVKPGQPQTVRLIWKQGQNEWKVSLNNGPEEPATKATITLPEGTGPTMFTVDIAGKQVGFKDPGGLTVWEEPKSGPPTSGPKSGPPGSTQILGPIITKQGKMVFYDLNQGDPVTIHYSLNLDDGNSVDPIIDNRGSGGP